MTRLLLVLLVAMGLLYGGYRHFQGGASPSPPPTADRPGVPLPRSGPSAARTVVKDYEKIEAANRAALDRTMNAAAGTRQPE